MINLLKGLLGFFLLVGATDMIGRIFWKREDKSSGRWLSWILAFFTIITPLFYILNLVKIPITYLTIVSTLTLIWVGVGRITKMKVFEVKKSKLGSIFFWLLVYLVIHLIFYSIYYTIPEWDSYGNILSVRENILNGSIISNYRPLFNASITILSVTTLIDPYILSPIFLIVMQSSLIFSIYLLRLGNKNKLLNNLLLASAVAVPVINMEIDMPRPQSILIIFIPIFFYYLHKYISSKGGFHEAFLLFWISIIGLLYHEFFLSLLFIVVILFTKKLFKYWQSDDRKDKTIVFLISIIIFMSTLLGYTYISMFRVVFGNIKIIFLNLINNFYWKWWFLNNELSADGLSTAWIGWKSVLTYYAYYLSPIIFGWLVVLMVKILKKNKMKSFHYYLLIFGSIFFIFTELLPRMNVGVLPERSWVFFDITVLLLVASYLKDIKISILIKYSLVILMGISLFGSFVVANGKKSLTSPEEMKAALWIKVNTSKESIFISQQANNKLVEFFGERKILSPTSDFFLSDELVKYNEIEICDLEKNNLELEEIKTKILNFNVLYGNVEKLANNINKTRENFQSNKYTCYPKQALTKAFPTYILYSLDKLEGLYSTRKWWQDANYYGAKLDKFKKLPLVYNTGGVKIWVLK